MQTSKQKTHGQFSSIGVESEDRSDLSNSTLPKTDPIFIKYTELLASVKTLLNHCFPKDQKARSDCFDKFIGSNKVSEDEFFFEEFVNTRANLIVRLAEYYDVNGVPRTEIDEELLRPYTILAQAILSHSPFETWNLLSWDQTSTPQKLQDIPNYSIIRDVDNFELWMKVTDPAVTDIEGDWMMKLISNKEESDERRTLAGVELWSYDADYIIVAGPPIWKKNDPKFELISKVSDQNLSLGLSSSRSLEGLPRIIAIAMLAKDYPKYEQSLLEEAVYWARTSQDPKISEFQRLRRIECTLGKIVEQLESQDSALSLRAADLFCHNFDSRKSRIIWLAELAVRCEKNRDLYVNRAITIAQRINSSTDIYEHIASHWFHEKMEAPALVALREIQYPYGYYRAVARALSVDSAISCETLAALKRDISFLRERYSKPGDLSPYRALAQAAILGFMPEAERGEVAKEIFTEMQRGIPLDETIPGIAAIIPYLPEVQLSETIDKIFQANTELSNDRLHRIEDFTAPLLMSDTYREKAREIFEGGENHCYLTFPKVLGSILAARSIEERNLAVEKVIEERFNNGFFIGIEYIGPYLTSNQREQLRSEISTAQPPEWLYRWDEFKERLLRGLDYSERQLQMMISHRAILSR